MFRLAADADVDKEDLARYGDVVNCNIYNLMLMGRGIETWNRRDVIAASDLPPELVHQRRVALTGPAMK